MREPQPTVLAVVSCLFLAVLGPACGQESKREDGTAGASTTAATSGIVTETTGEAEAECDGSPFDCRDGLPPRCDHVPFAASCVDGRYQCVGSTPSTECYCPDAATETFCKAGEPGQCGDLPVASLCEGPPGLGEWVCPEGSTPVETCQTPDSGTTDGGTTDTTDGGTTDTTGPPKG